MPDPTARMTRKPRVSILAILSILAAIATAGAGVFFFTVQSKQWIGFVGMMLLAMAFAVFGVVELGAHGRDKALWRTYQNAFDEVTRRHDEEAVDKAEAGDEPSFFDDLDDDSGADPEPDPTQTQAKKHVYTPLDVLEAKKIARDTTEETPSTRDTMPGAGKKIMPPVTSTGSLPTPGMVTIPTTTETAEEESTEVESSAAQDLDISALVDADALDKDEDTTAAEDKTEDTAAAEDTATDEDKTEDEDKAEDTAATEDTAEDEGSAPVEVTGEDEDTAESSVLADVNGGDELDEAVDADTAATTAEDITPVEDTTEATTPDESKDEDAGTSVVVDSKSGSSFNLLGFGKQDKE